MKKAEKAENLKEVKQAKNMAMLIKSCLRSQPPVEILVAGQNLVMAIVLCLLVIQSRL